MKMTNYEGIVEIQVFSEHNLYKKEINDLLSVGWKLLEIQTVPTYETVGFFRLRHVQDGTRNRFVLGRPKEILAKKEDERHSEYVTRLRKLRKGDC